MTDRRGGEKRKIRRDDLRTFARLVSYAKPYWFKLAVGAVASMVGGGSILGMLLAAQTTLGYLVDHREAMRGDPSAEAASPAGGEASAVPGGASVSGGAAAAPGDSGGNADLAGKLAAKIPGGAAAGGASVEFLRREGVKGLVPLCGILMLFIALNSLCQFASMYCLQWVGQRVVMDLREAIFAHLQRLPLAFYNAQKAGDTMSRTVADTQLLQTTVSNVITDAIRQPVMIALGLATVLVLNWRLALFSVVLVPTVVVPIVAIGRKLRRISRDGQKRLAELTSVMKEALDGVSVVKAFGQEERMEAAFDSQCRGFFRQMIRAVKAKALNEPISHTIGGLGGMGVLVYAMATGMPIERCFIFAAAIWWLYEPIKKVGRIFMEIQQSSGAADRVFEILDAPVTVSDAPGAAEPAGPLEKIEFRGVRFRYGDKTVFDGLNLEIRAGESLAVVGPSGGGKTTLVNLLLRFFDPEGGSVSRNGVDLRALRLDGIRARMGLVLQDTFLFNDTIAANIAFGKPDATRAEIEEAARLAHADEFIRAKPDGYDTVVGERGTALSGGQKQRIAIARALIRKPELLVLDEATSALDTDSERAVQAAIDELMARLTVVVIAHRLSTVAKCRRIAVVSGGGVAEYGTKDELLAIPGGIFARLHKLQFSVP